MNEIKATDILPAVTMLRPVRTDSVEFYELMDSIRKYGVLNSILVKPHHTTEGKYQIIDGSWRFAAATRVGQKYLPCIVTEQMGEEEYLSLQIQANAITFQTRPVEYARQMERMIELRESEGNPLTRTELAGVVGKSAGWVTARLKLLKLSEAAQGLVNDGKLSLTKAVALARINLHRYQDEFLLKADEMTGRDFELAVGKFISIKRDEKMQGRRDEREVFNLMPRLQSMDSLLIELDRMHNLSEIITKKGLTTAYEGCIITLQWVLNLHDEGRLQQVKEIRHKLTGTDRLAIIAKQRFEELKEIRELTEKRRGDNETVD